MDLVNALIRWLKNLVLNYICILRIQTSKSYICLYIFTYIVLFYKGLGALDYQNAMLH